MAQLVVNEPNHTQQVAATLFPFLRDWTLKWNAAAVITGPARVISIAAPDSRVIPVAARINRNIAV